MSCHVGKADSDEKFAANFIPHDAGRHRLDVKFNGEKVPGSPRFCEVKDPNTPLMAPGLLTGKIKASDLNGNTLTRFIICNLRLRCSNYWLLKKLLQPPMH